MRKLGKASVIILAIIGAKTVLKTANRILTDTFESVEVTVNTKGNKEVTEPKDND